MPTSDEPIVRAIVAATVASIRAEVEGRLKLAHQRKLSAHRVRKIHFYSGQIDAYKTLLEFIDTQPAYKSESAQ